jgi:hypothetical protein
MSLRANAVSEAISLIELGDTYNYVRCKCCFVGKERLLAMTCELESNVR